MIGLGIIIYFLGLVIYGIYFFQHNHIIGHDLDFDYGWAVARWVFWPLTLIYLIFWELAKVFLDILTMILYLLGES